jgi:citrate synthase
MREWKGTTMTDPAELRIGEPDFKIGRPRQVYTGATRRPYVPIGER